MEDVLEKLETGSLSFGSQQSQDGKTSSFEGLYKNWGKNGQEERRKELLETQKSNRNTKLDIFRGILDLVNAVEEHDIFRSDKKVHYRPSIYVAGFNKAHPTYKNVLMMSEWMIEKPSDFEENWYITPCPKGTRVLVVATQGKTKCYTKHGHFLFETRSSLPGGHPSDNKEKFCVLDCFYEEKNNTLYVLDLLAWNNQPMTECETEFRNYWLQSQFDEKPQLQIVTKRNKIKFILLPKVSCSSDELNKFMMNYPHFDNDVPPLDGLLFYHKRAHYVSGETPLVGWLYPYMVPEVLGAGITVHQIYMLQKPVSYVNQADFIKKFQEKQDKQAKRMNKSRRTSTNSTAMDTADVTKNKMEEEDSAADKTAVESQEVESTTMEAEECSEVIKDKTTVQSQDVKSTTMEAEECTEVTKDKTTVQSQDVKSTTKETEECTEVTKDKTTVQSQDVKSTTMEAEECTEVTKDKTTVQSQDCNFTTMEAEEGFTEVTKDNKNNNDECQPPEVNSETVAKSQVTGQENV